MVSGFSATDTLVTFDVGVGNRAATGARTLTLQGVGLEFADAVTVAPGAVRIATVTPSSLSRETTTDVVVTGSNLDAVTGWQLGQGIAVTAATATATRATLSAAVGADAFAGPRDLVAVAPLDRATLAAAIVIVGGDPVVSDVSPAYAVRGQSTAVRLEGANLDRVDSASFGTRVTVADFVVQSPSVATATITVRDDAAAGPRTVTVRTDDERFFDFDRAFSVRRGQPSIEALRPATLRQGDATFLTLDGLNLDGTTRVDLGEGIEVVEIHAATATSITVDVVVGRDAPLGYRSLSLTAPAGTLTRPDAIFVGEYQPPPLALAVPVEVATGDVELGAIGSAGIEIENRGSQDETLDLLIADGDVERFFLIDAEGRQTSRVSVDVPAGERVPVVVEFEPSVRGRTGVEVQLVAQGRSDAVPSVIVRGNGVRATLLKSLESPADFGVLERVDGAARLERVDTLLADGAPARTVLVTGWDWSLTLNGEPTDAVLDVEPTSTVSDGTLWWGSTDVSWSLRGPVGRYDGELRLFTDSASAPTVPVRFRVDLVDGGGDDAGSADVGEDASDAGDIGSDAGADAGVDTTPDADTGGTDSGITDAGDDDGSDATADASSDLGGDDSGSGGGGKKGCASAPASSATPWLAALALVGAAARRRRR